MDLQVETEGSGSFRRFLFCMVLVALVCLGGCAPKEPGTTMVPVAKKTIDPTQMTRLAEAIQFETEMKFQANDRVLANTDFDSPLKRQMAATVAVVAHRGSSVIYTTGTCIDETRGLVMTCAHGVVYMYGTGEENYDFSIISRTGVETKARLVGYDTRHEVALLEPIYRQVNLDKRYGGVYLHRHLGYIAYDDSLKMEEEIEGRDVCGVGYTVERTPVMQLRDGVVKQQIVTDWAEIEQLLKQTFGVSLDIATMEAVECTCQSEEGMSGGPIIDVKSGQPVGLMIYGFFYEDGSYTASGPTWEEALAAADRILKKSEGSTFDPEGEPVLISR